MRTSAGFQVDATVGADRLLMGQILDGWYRQIAALGGIAAPGGRPAVSPDVRAAYASGVARLLASVAAAAGTSVFELYWANRGRIPPWAWQEPHHRLAGIATPVPDGLWPVPGTGAVSMSVAGVSVTILPDGFDPALTGRAETRSTWRWQAPGYQYQLRARAGQGTALDGAAEFVTGINPIAAPCVTVQTFYCRDLGPDDLAGYGRGTTPEDMAGGAVHPWSTSVAFHEGLHGMDTTDFLRTRTPPAFGGRAGMTVAMFSDATMRWNSEWRAYQALAGAVSHARTDKVGLTTYDDYQRQFPPPPVRPDARPVVYVTPHRPRLPSTRDRTVSAAHSPVQPGRRRVRPARAGHVETVRGRRAPVPRDNPRSPRGADPGAGPAGRPRRRRVRAARIDGLRGVHHPHHERCQAGSMTTFVIRLIAPRPTFALDITEEERAIMNRHAAYWQPRIEAGHAVVFGPVLSDAGTFGLGVVEAEDEDELRSFAAADPAVTAGTAALEFGKLLGGFVRPQLPARPTAAPGPPDNSKKRRGRPRLRVVRSGNPARTARNDSPAK